MSAADRIKQWSWKPGQSGNPAGKSKKPRRSFDAVRKLEALHVDPLEEVVALAQDTALPKVARLKAWLALMDYCYPKLSPIASHENVSARLEELQRSWDTATLDEFNQAFQKELDTLPDEAKAGLSKLEAMGRIGPIIMQALLKFVEQRHEQAQAQAPQDPEQPGLKVVKM
jgi:hypothetical protein